MTEIVQFKSLYNPTTWLSLKKIKKLLSEVEEALANVKLEDKIVLNIEKYTKEKLGNKFGNNKKNKKTLEKAELAKKDIEQNKEFLEQLQKELRNAIDSFKDKEPIK